MVGAMAWGNELLCFAASVSYRGILVTQAIRRIADLLRDHSPKVFERMTMGYAPDQPRCALTQDFQSA